MALAQNLLTFEVVKIIWEEGGRFLHPDKDEGFARIGEVLERALGAVGSDGGRATTKDFRMVYHRAWKAVLEELVPYEAHERVTERYKRLVF